MSFDSTTAIINTEKIPPFLSFLFIFHIYHTFFYDHPTEDTKNTAQNADFYGEIFSICIPDTDKVKKSQKGFVFI